MEQRLNTLMQQKWMAKLVRFDYEFQYTKEAYNMVSDTLLRTLAEPREALDIIIVNSALC